MLLSKKMPNNVETQCLFVLTIAQNNEYNGALWHHSIVLEWHLFGYKHENLILRPKFSTILVVSQLNWVDVVCCTNWFTNLGKKFQIQRNLLKQSKILHKYKLSLIPAQYIPSVDSSGFSQTSQVQSWKNVIRRNKNIPI